MNTLSYNGWKITESMPGDFYATNGKYNIHFQAEYKPGLYSKVLGYYDIKKDRYYSAQRFLYKFINLIQEMAFTLLQHGRLWDCKNNCPALKTYKKDMELYYKKCLEKGLSISPFLESLYN
mgnify:CR=1 FL=1